MISRLHADLTQQMQQNNWPVTFSMGAVICLAAPDCAHEVKQSIKNGIRFVTYTGKSGTSDPSGTKEAKAVVK